MNKKSAILLCTAAIGVSLLSAVSVAKGITYISGSSVTHGSSCQWHHYTETKATYSSNGVKEYWACCSHPELGPSFESPTSGVITDSSHPAGFASSITANDPRYIAPYSEAISFEDGVVPSFIAPKQNVASIEVVDGGTSGSKCLKATIAQSDYGIYFSKYYLDQVFSDPEIVAFTFDAKGSYAASNFRHKTNGTNVCYEINGTGYGLETNWKRFTFTRAFYNDYKDGDAVIFGGGTPAGESIYIDNITPVKEAMPSFGFDNGSSTLSLTNAVIRTHGPTSSIPYFQYLCNSGIIASVEYDYQNKTEGLRSLKVTKNSGYVAFYFSSAFRNALPDNGSVDIDIYSSVGANGMSAGNFIDGLNNRTVGSKTAGKWETFTFTKDQMSLDGRFLIVQGSTGGVWQFDNIRINSVQTNEEEFINLGQRFVSDVNATTTIATKHPVTSILSASIDGTNVLNNLASFGSGGVAVKNSYLTKGDHDIIFKYRSGNQIYAEHFYVAVSLLETMSPVSASLTYLSDGYYAVSASADIYRIACGDKEVPFEYNGSSLLIPEAALIQLLPESDGKKISGAVDLTLYSLAKAYSLQVNVTLSGGDNTKSVPTYAGKGIWTHAYSSTNSYANRTNYETYYNKSKLAEFDNTGIEVIYEQAQAITVNDKTLPACFRYLFDNAAALGKKVMIVDKALGDMTRLTTSLIGQDFTVGGVNFNFASTAELDAYVESRLNIYINEPACYGISVGDEQTYAMLCGGFKDVMQSLHRVLNKLDRNDFVLNCNMNPLFATYECLAGPDQVGNHEADWVTYMEKYLEVSGNNYIQYDIYPLMDETKTSGGAFYDSEGNMTSAGYGISNFGMRNLVLAAKVAKDHNVELHCVTQTLTNNNTRVLNNTDVSFLNNMLLGFGVKHVSWFVYCCRAYTGTETWVEEGEMLKKDGTKNDLYYYMQRMVAEINAFKNTVSAFEYKWCHLYKGSDAKDAWFYNGTCNNSAFAKYYPSESTYGQVSAYSVDKSWGLISAMQNSDSKYMYMVQNIHNDFDNVVLESHTITFDSNNYNYALVYEAGLPRFVKLGDNGAILSRNKKKTLSLKLSSGNAAFVVLF